MLSTCGWHAQASWNDSPQPTDWTPLAWGSLLLPPGTTTMDAELTGCEQTTLALLAYAQHGAIHLEADLRVDT